jgi:hypothetical protein
MPGRGIKGFEVTVLPQVPIRSGAFILERTACPGARELEVMAKRRLAVERREEPDHLVAVRPRRMMAREEHRGVLIDGLQEDLETHREGLGHLVISRAESVGRTDFWMWWKQLHRFNGSRLTIFSRDEMEIERLDSRSAGISQRLLRRAEHS